MSLIVGLLLALLAAVTTLAVKHLQGWLIARETERLFGDAIAAVLCMPRADVVVRSRCDLFAPWRHEVRVHVADSTKRRAAERLMLAMIEAGQRLARGEGS